ncbi:hypothetical protein BDF19DRAFT_422247 [Syncephalis fuscata]|nr:hypothetical protein BDF19DRAFT_422247 [Syncephalis fuscata]
MSKEQPPPTLVVAEHSNLLGFLTNLLDPLQRETWSPLLPLPILATLHAIKVTLDYRARLRTMSGPRPPLVQGLFVVMAMALGGSTSAAVLMGLPPSWLSSNTTLPTYAIVYLAMFRAPGDIAFRLLDAIEPYIRPILLLADGLTRANAQAGFAIESIRAMPALQNSLIAQLLCGTLAGCGGGIITDAFNLTAADWGLRTPAAFKEEHYDLRVSLSTTLIYAMTTLNTPDKISYADAILARLSPSLIGSPTDGFLVLDPREAKCLAGLLFASAQLWRRYSFLVLKPTKRTNSDKKEMELTALLHYSEDSGTEEEEGEEGEHDEHNDEKHKKVRRRRKGRHSHKHDE